MKSKLNKLDIFLLILIGIITFFSVENILTAYDELFFYNSMKRMALGDVIYKDLNVIIMPLYFFLGSIFFKINTNMSMFFIFDKILYIILHSVIYLILRKKNKESVSFLITNVCLFFIVYFEYSRLCLLLMLFMVFLYEYLDKKNSLYYILQGFLVGLLVLTKQNIAAITIISLTIYLIIIKFLKRKNKIDIKFKDILKGFIGFIIPIGLFFIYLIKNNALLDFLDLIVFGLKDFNNKNGLFFTSDSFIFEIWAVVFIFITFIKLIVRILKSKEIKDIFYLSLLLGLLTNIYPILDKNHLIPALTFCLLIEFAIFYPNRKLDILPIKNLTMYIIVVIFVMIKIFPSLYLCNSNYYVKSTLNNLENVYIQQNQEKNYPIFNDYLNENYNISNIKFACVDGSMFYAINNRYDKYYATFLNGNFGAKTPTEIIEKDLNEENLIMISLYGKENLWQYPEDEIISYLEENAKCIDEIDVYRIYKKD